MTSWRFVRRCYVCVHPAHGKQVGVYALLFGHKQLNASTGGLIQQVHDVEAKRECLHQFITADGNTQVLLDGGYGVGGIDYDKVTYFIDFKAVLRQALNALLHQISDGGIADLMGALQITNDVHVVPPVWVSVWGIGDKRVGGKCHGA